jgi:hypothetical protein
MSKIAFDNAAELKSAMKRYLDAFPGDTICALQICEGLGGCGCPTRCRWTR